VIQNAHGFPSTTLRFSPPSGEAGQNENESKEEKQSDGDVSAGNRLEAGRCRWLLSGSADNTVRVVPVSSLSPPGALASFLLFFSLFPAPCLCFSGD
jgi:hypothetical protein